ncbi:MAG: hypothetical protein QXR34_05565 [Saccharolobus sp.]
MGYRSLLYHVRVKAFNAYLYMTSRKYITTRRLALKYAKRKKRLL